MIFSRAISSRTVLRRCFLELMKKIFLNILALCCPCITPASTVSQVFLTSLEKGLLLCVSFCYMLTSINGPAKHREFGTWLLNLY